MPPSNPVPQNGTTPKLVLRIRSLSTKKLAGVLVGTLLVTIAIAAAGVHFWRGHTDALRQAQIQQTLKENAKSVRFVENKGQIPSKDVLYYFETSKGSAYIERNRIRFVAKEEGATEHEHESRGQKAPLAAPATGTIGAHAFTIDLEGASPSSTVRTGEYFGTRYNYFLGEDSSKWVTGIRAAKELTLEDVYPGIDLRLYSTQESSLEFDWIVDAGADLSRVRMRFGGQDSLAVDKDGSLKVGLRFTDVRFHLPESYQVTDKGKTPVAVAFNQETANSINFRTESQIDPQLPLVIDPTLTWGTFMDGNSASFDAYLFAIQVDPADGMVYCAGYSDIDIPTASAPYDANGLYNTITNIQNNRNAAVIYRISSNGSDLVDLTLYGPSSLGGGESVRAFALSLSTNRVFVGGITSANLPTAGTPFDNTRDGTDGWVAAFSRDLGTLNYATYLGGSGNESRGVTSIRATSDTAFTVGLTAAATLPAAYLSTGAYQTTFGGGTDMYIAKFGPTTINTLAWGTYVGGNQDDVFNDLEVFSDGRVAFGGYGSSTFTEVNSAAARSTATNEDGIIGVLKSDGTGVNYLDELGGDNADRINDVEIAGSTLYWTGSVSSGFPASGGYDTSQNGNEDAVVGKVSDTGGSGTYVASFYGTSSTDRGVGIKVVTRQDCSGSSVLFVLVFGSVGGTGLPTKNVNGESFFNANYTAGGSSAFDMFFGGFNSGLTGLVYGTYIGGNQDDYLGLTGDARGGNHLWINGNSIYVGTTTHSATHTPSIVGGTGFDTSKSNSTDDSHVIFGVQAKSIGDLDFGDAPVAYGSPSHTMDCSKLRIGALQDAETSHQASASANGDDTNGVDDEDGVASLPSVYAGGPQTISITVNNLLNTTGSTANLYAWIDLDSDSNFEASEIQTATVVTGTTSGSQTFTWSGVTVSGSAPYVRIRMTTDALADVSGTAAVDERSTVGATDGEVEDYLLTVLPSVNLAITKTDGATTYTPGNSVTYTIVVSNSGPSNATGATVADTIPATITGTTIGCVASGTASCGTNGSSGNNLLYTGVSINSGAGNFLTITVGGTVSAAATGDLVNTATVTASASQFDTNTANNTATDTDTANRLTNLGISKTDGSATYTPGASITYTIVVSNAGPSNATGASVADTIPASITGTTIGCVASGSALCGTNASSGNSLSYTGVSIPVGAANYLTITVSGTVSVSTTGNLVNTATVTAGSGQTDSVSSNNSATDTDTSSPSTDLAITKTDGSATYAPGASITYTIVVSNNGPSNATGASVADTIPASITGTTIGCVASGSALCGTNASSGNSLSYTGVSIPVGAANYLTITVSGTVSVTTSGNLVNTATVTAGSGQTDSVSSNNSATDTDTSSPSTDLAITKTDGSATYAPGAPITYTIVVSNNGPSNATGASVADTIPASITGTTIGCVASGTANCGTNASAGNNLSFTGVSISVGAANYLTITVSGTVSVTTTGNLVNTATVAAGSGQNDSVSSNNSATDTDTSSPSTDLAITKTDGSATYAPGASITYTIVVSNNGPSNATGASVADTIPASITGTTIGCVASGSALCGTNASSGNSLSYTGVSIPVGAANYLTITVSGTVSVTTTGNLVNTATVTAGSGQTDSVSSNNSATDTDTSSPSTDLAITKTDGSATYAPGASITYTIVVSNNGPSNATGASVADTIPASITGTTIGCVASGTANCGTNASAGNNLSFTGVSISVGAANYLTITVTGTISSSATGNLVNTATVAPGSGEGDANTGNNTATDTDTYSPLSDLAITKTDGVTAVDAGGTTTYTIVVSNAGPSPADGAVFKDALATGLNVTAVTCGSAANGAVCPTVPNTTVALMQGSGIVIPTLPATGSVTFTVTATVTAVGGSVTNTATVTPPIGTNDPTPGNNSATDTDTVTPTANLAITKTDGVTAVDAGGTTTYTIVVSNAGPSPADGAVFKDALAAGLNVTAVTCGSAANGAVCPTVPNTTVALMQGSGIVIPTLPATGSVTFTVSANVTATNGSITNTATIAPPSGTNDPTPGNNSAQDTDTVNPVTDLAITKTDGSAKYTPGSPISYTIVVSNNGPSNATGVSVNDSIPGVISGVTIGCVATGTAACGTNASAGNNLSYTGISISAGAGNFLTLTVSGTVSSSANGDLVNTATVTVGQDQKDSLLTNNTAVDTDTVDPKADLAVTKTDGLTTAIPGTSTVYTIVVRNNGPSDVADAVVTDNIPAGITSWAWACSGTTGGGSGCDAAASNSSNFSDTVNLPSGATITYSVTAQISPTATGTLINNVNIGAPQGTTDTDLNNNNANDQDTLTPIADLAIQKNGPGMVAPNGSVTYTIRVSNAGPSSANGAIVADTLPVTGATWTCGAETGGATCGTGAGSGNMNVAVGAFPPGGSVTYTVIGTAPLSGTFVNTASITPGNGISDPNTSNNSSSVTTGIGVVPTTADLAVIKSGPGTVSPNGAVSYQIVVTNVGPAAANGATVVDPVPLTGVTWSCAGETAGAQCGTANGAGSINTTISLLPAGASVTFTVNGLAPASGSITNTVTVAPPPGVTDPDTANNTSSVTTAIQIPSDIADVYAIKTGPATVQPNGTQSYKVIVGNSGPAGVTNARFQDDVPGVLTGVSWNCGSETGSASCGTTSGSGNTIDAVIANLPAHGTVTFTINTTVPASGQWVNSARVVLPTGVGDSDGTDNIAGPVITNLVTRTDLAVTKTDGAATYAPGGVTTYTIVVTNNGPDGVVGATVVDNLPNDVVSWTWTCSGATGGAGGCDGVTGSSANFTDTVDLPSGATITYTVAAQTSPSATGNLVNVVNVAVPDGAVELNPANNSARDTDTPLRTTDLAITKSDGSATYTPGAPISYTIVVTNNGPSNTTAATVTDTVPSVITGTSISCVATGAASCGTNASIGNTVLLQNLAIAAGPGNFLTLTIGGTVIPSASGDLVNLASVYAGPGEFDPVLSNNVSYDTDTPNPLTDLAVSKTDNSPTYTPGSPISYTIVVSNSGPSNSIGAAVVDAIPAAISGTSVVCVPSGNATCGPNASVGNALSFPSTSIAAGASNFLTITVTGTVSPSASGDLTNIVTVNAGPGQNDLLLPNNTATDTDTVQPVTDLSITKTDGSTQYVPGGPISYSIVVRNAGPSNATGVSVADAVPSSITGVTIACAVSGSATCGTNASAGNSLSFTGISIPAGAANYLTFTVSGTVSPAATGNLVNTATVTAGQGQNDPTPENNVAVDTDTASPRTDLAVTKTDGSPTYIPGSAISYTIIVSNNGPSNASGVSVADAVPSSVIGVTIACVPSGIAQCGTNSSAGNNLLFTGVAIEVGAGNFLTITVSGMVNPAATGNLVNTVTATAGSGQTDPTPFNNSATDTDTASPQIDLAVTKTDGSATYTAGSAITYTMVVSNNGPSNATGASVSDSIPAVIGGVTIGCVSSGNASCGTNASVGNSLSFTGVSIPSGAGNFLTLTVSGTVSSAATGNLVNTVNVTADQGQTDATTDNNTAVDTDTPDPKVDLAVTKTDGVTTVVPGTSTAYTIVVSNSGPSDVSGAIVTDNIPVGLKSWTWTCSGVSGGATGCDAAASNSSNFVDTVNLPAGSSITYTVTAKISPEATGNLVNIVTVDTQGAATDTNPENNTATDQDTLSPEANLAVQKNGPGMVEPNGTVVYTIQVSNAGPSSANGALVNDPLPVSAATWTCGAETGGATCGTTAGSGSINTTVATFPPGGSVTYTVTGTGPGSGTFVNTATVAPPNGVVDPELSNNTSSVTTGVGTVPTTADLAVIKSGPSTAAPNGNVTYVIVVTNVGPAAANGATVVDPVPLTGVTWTCGGETAGAVCGTANGAGNINTTVATFPAGASVTFTVKGTAPVSGTLLNTVTVAPPPGVSDPNSSNNTSSVSTVIQTPTGSADIFAIKTGQATVQANGTESYKVIIGNRGPDVVSNAKFEDQVPAYLSNVTWTCGAETGAASCGATGGTGNTIVATIASLPPHSTVTFTINATVPSRGQWVNSARVVLPQGTVDDDESNNIGGPVITNLVPSADLAVTKTDGSASYIPGGTSVYTIVVSNNGPDGVQGATVTDNLPAGATSWSWACAGVTGGAGGCDPAASNSANFSDTVDLPSGATITYTVTMQISPTATGNLENTVAVAAPSGVVEPTTENNSATDIDAPMPSTDLAIVKSASLANVLAGDSVTYTILVTNAGPGIATGALVTDLLPSSLVNATWTCAASPGSSCTSPNGSGDISTTVNLQSGGSATFTVTAQVALDAPAGTLSNTATVAAPPNVIDPNPNDNISTSTINVARNPLPGPGLPFPSTEPSDQKAGSILVYPIYTSNPVNRGLEDTRLNLTNTDQQQSISVHLFLVDGATCSIADTFVCLTANQTISVLASDIDPGSSGYVIAVAVNSDGCPALRNQLIGDEYVKFASGHFANLGAEAISGLAGLLNDPACISGTSTSATLRFDGVSYNRLASTVAVDSIPSRVEGNDTMLILNRIGGDLSNSALPIGSVFGVLYDDAEAPHSFNYTSGQCQLRGSLTNDFPRTTPNLESVISAGHTGWMKLWQRDGGALFGASINYHPNVGSSPTAFNDGRNLRMLTLTDKATLVIPIFPPRC